MRVLVVAYACEPGRGSEPGAGWGLVHALEGFAEGVVLTGTEHEVALNDFAGLHPGWGFRFEAVAEPWWTTHAKRLRVGWFLAYLAWLRGAQRRARQLVATDRFDLIYHATYSTYWLPSPARDLDLPVIWGPMGGAVTTPRSLWPVLGWRGVADEIVDLVSTRAAALLPATRRTWRGVDRRLIQNAETMSKIGPHVGGHSTLLNHAMFTVADTLSDRAREDFILWVSPLTSRKGPRLAVHALAATRGDLCMTMAGDGPERGPVERLARRLGVNERLSMLGRIPRAEVLDLMSRAGVVVFTGLREEGGIALAEALLAGAPIVALGNGGVVNLAQPELDPSRIAIIEPGGVAETAARMAEAIEEMVSRLATVKRGSLLDQAGAVAELEAIFRGVVSDA